jgi:hypothetical protein
MIGELLGESKGKRIVRRVLGINPSFEDGDTHLSRQDGSAVGEGHGIISTPSTPPRRHLGWRKDAGIRDDRGKGKSYWVVR